MKIKNQKGFTITEVLVAAGMLGIVSLVAVQLTKDMAANKAISDVNNDIAAYKQKVNGLLTNPAHCNANFRNDATGTLAPTELRKCNITGPTVNCSSTGTSQTDIPVHTTTWVQSSTGLTRRLRLVSISQSVAPTASTVIANLELRTVVEGRISTEGVNVDVKTKRETVNFTVPVVVNGSVIQGCPRTWNSTTIY